MTDIRITWKVTNQHTRTMSEAQFADWVAETFRSDGLDPTDLDAVYNRLDERDWRSDEALIDLATDSNWLDSPEAEITDLNTESGAA